MSYRYLRRFTCISGPMRLQLAAATVAMLLPHLAHAAVLVSNIDEPRRFASTIQQDPDLGVDPPVEYPWGAQSFNTDATAQALQSIEVLLGRRVGDPTVVAELRADDGMDAPGAVLATLSLGPVSTGPAEKVTLLPTTPVNLAPSTLYWLVMGAFGAGSYEFEYAEGNAFTGPGTFGNYSYSSDRGATWTGFGGDNPFKLRVNVARTDVDAPGMPASMALGALALLLARRRQRTQRARLS